MICDTRYIYIIVPNEDTNQHDKLLEVMGPVGHVVIVCTAFLFVCLFVSIFVDCRTKYETENHGFEFCGVFSAIRFWLFRNNAKVIANECWPCTVDISCSDLHRYIYIYIHILICVMLRITTQPMNESRIAGTSEYVWFGPVIHNCILCTKCDSEISNMNIENFFIQLCYHKYKASIHEAT